MSPFQEQLASMKNLHAAFQRVRTKGGSAGIDGIDIETFKADLDSQLEQLSSDLSSCNYRPQSYRIVSIPKNQGKGHRHIVIATIRDRIAMASCAEILYPMIEPVFHPCSFAYRRGMGVHDALAKVVEYRDRGLTQVLHCDIDHFFDSVDHHLLTENLRMYLDEIYPDAVPIIFSWLTNNIISHSGIYTPGIGLPQGLPISPLLANLFLTPFDRFIVEAGWKLVRYADDFVICAKSEDEIATALQEVKLHLGRLHLKIKESKTEILSFEKGFTFLGAAFKDNDILPAVAHPYEADFAPPPSTFKKKKDKVTISWKQDLKTLYIQEQGSQLGCHGNRLVVNRQGKMLIDLAAHHIKQIYTFGRIQITAAAMSFCLIRKIPIYLFSGKGSYYGVLRSPTDQKIKLRKKQFFLAQDRETVLSLSKSFVRGKLFNYRVCLRQFKKNELLNSDVDLEEMEQYLNRVDTVDNLDQLRGIEGAATACWYRNFAKCFRKDLQFNGRNRRPPLDPVNSFLSFGYTMLYYNIYSFLCIRGLDPDMGFFHVYSSGHHSLASDIIEEFRAPIIDRMVVSLCNENGITSDDFYLGEGSPQPCLMKDETRKQFLQTFEEKMHSPISHPDAKDPVDWRRCIELQVQRLCRFLDEKVKKYEPFKIK